MSETGTDAAVESTATTGPAAPSGADARGDRVLAYLVDFVLLSALVFVMWLVSVGARFAVIGASMDVGSRESMVAANLGVVVLQVALWALIGVLVFAYFTYLDGAADGTLGKRVMDVAVRRENGSAPGLKATAIRTGVLMLPFPLMALLGVLLGPLGFVIAVVLMAGWLLVEAVVLAVSEDGRRLGDRLAGTAVVSRP